jgi:hypothetical protein
LQRRVDQDAAEVSVMIGPGLGRAAAGAKLGGVTGRHRAF